MAEEYSVKTENWQGSKIRFGCWGNIHTCQIFPQGPYLDMNTSQNFSPMPFMELKVE